MRVCGVKQPPESHPRSFFDHDLHQPFAESSALVLGNDVDIGEVGQRHPVRDRAAEPNHHTGRFVVAPNHTPGPRDLTLHVRTRAPSLSVRVLRQEAPHTIKVHALKVVIKFKGHSDTLGARWTAVAPSQSDARTGSQPA